MTSRTAARWGIGFALTLTLLSRGVFALAEPRALIAADVVQDDAFYYLTIARNVVRGQGLSFDGEDPTNAFQPLYLALLLPIQALAGDDPWRPLRGAVWLLWAIALATVPLVYGLARRLAGDGAAWIATLAFAVSPQLSTLGVNGLETGLALALGLVIALAYLRWLAPDCQPPARAAIGFGALGGLAVLARVDLALWLAALGVDWLHRAQRRDQLRAVLRPLALTAATSLAVWLPWGLASALWTGAWLPTSGAASREIAHQLGWSNLPAVFGATPGITFDPGSVPLAWRADVAARALYIWLFEQPLLAPLRLSVDYGVWPALSRYAPYRLFAASPWLGLAALVAAAGLLRWAWRRVPSAALDEARPSLAFAVTCYTLAMWLGYVFVAPAHWYFARYLALPIWLATLVALAPVARYVRVRPLRSPRGVVAVALGVWVVGIQLSLLAGFRGQRIWADPSERGFLASWEALGDRIPPDATIGAFQAGIYAWFSDHPVRNLDGKVNVRTQRALRERRVHRYVLDSEIDYVLDQPAIARVLMLRHAPAEERTRFVPVAREKRRTGAVLYRVERQDAG
jgi:hypothetical protein